MKPAVRAFLFAGLAVSATSFAARPDDPESMQKIQERAASARHVVALEGTQITTGASHAQSQVRGDVVSSSGRALVLDTAQGRRAFDTGRLAFRRDLRHGEQVKLALRTEEGRVVPWAIWTADAWQGDAPLAAEPEP